MLSLEEKFDQFRTQETQLRDEIHSVINRACGEYAMTLCQVVGVLESIKLEKMEDGREVD